MSGVAPLLIFSGLCLCILAMYLMDTLQVLLRTMSGLAGVAILGAHLGSVVMLANRMATAAALLLLGYLVDTGASPVRLLLAYAVISCVLALSHAAFLRKQLVFRSMLYACAVFYRRPVELGRMLSTARVIRGASEFKVSAPVAFVSALGLLGFLGPSLAAALVPGFRATLMQSGFVLNSIATIVSVVIVEKGISMTIDRGSAAEISRLYDSYVVSRAIGYVCGSGLFAIAWLAFLRSAG